MHSAGASTTVDALPPYEYQSSARTPYMALFFPQSASGPVASFLDRSPMYTSYDQDFAPAIGFGGQQQQSADISAGQAIRIPAVFPSNAKSPTSGRAEEPFLHQPSQEQYPASDKSATSALQSVALPSADPACIAPMNFLSTDSYPFAASSIVRSPIALPMNPMTPPPGRRLLSGLPKRDTASCARPREKNHGCWMCEKAFDRPSTLRKHLLVHTGEKAFVCDICGRRFGVASNLNRHVKKCLLRPVNVAKAGQSTAQAAVNGHSPTSPSAGSPAGETSLPSSPSNLSSTSRTKRRGCNVDDSSAVHNTDAINPSESNLPKSAPKVATASKRRRRAPSPSRWIPTSLLSFNLLTLELTKSTSVPLPPVSAYKDSISNEWIEERDSWDENVTVTPYHPFGWKGRLPGPGLGFGGKDVGNLSLGAGFAMGRLVVF